MGYQGIAEHDVYDVLADVEQRYPVDRDRVYLTGISMGGGGALWLALTRPDVWAAVAPLCPSPFPEQRSSCRQCAQPADPALPWRPGPHRSRARVAATGSAACFTAGVAVDYLEYPGVRHNVWDLAYRGGALFDWLAEFRRNPLPGARPLRHPLLPLRSAPTGSASTA